MARIYSVLIVLAVWCTIYLPGLGTLEIKGEEGRRILPAITMLQTGNYIVPQVGSDPYFSKPPLVNWLVAASFQIFGQRNEWAARISSVLCVLAVAIAFATIGRGALGANGSLIGALVWLTNFGMIEKGRLIEIEALYASLSGLAFITWLSWWQQGRSKWLTWIVPWIFLGLGLLAKGPLHLVFFYAVVLAVLYRAGELRTLWNSAHLFGLGLMLAIFAAWAIPCLRLMQDSNVTHVWARQFSGRLSGEDFKLSGWVMNIPRGLCYFLPWTVLFAFAHKAQFQFERTAAVARGLRLGIAVSFLGISLLPGTLPRYTMPLLAPAAWLVATLLTAGRLEVPKRFQFRWPKLLPWELRLPLTWSALVCLGIAIYAFALMPFLVRREKVRNIAAQINAALPPREPLYALDPDYQPFLFYVRDPIVYLDKPAALPRAARFVLVQRRDEEQVASLPNRESLESILRLKDYRGKEVVILKVRDGT